MRASCCLLAIAILAAGCAEVPLANTTADMEGKRFDPPVRGQSALYLYRSGLLGGEVAFSLTDDRQQIGILAEGTWIRIDVAPGRHTIGCRVINRAAGAPGPGAVNDMQVDVAAGETRFVEVKIWPGPPLSPRCIATEVSPDQGRTGVTRGKRAVTVR